MSIIDDLISIVAVDAEIKDVRQGPFQTAVLSRNCGLASTPSNHSYQHGTAMVTDAGLLIGRRARDVALLAKSEREFEAAIGTAALNSLIDIDESKCTELNAIDLLAQKARDKNMALIGHFPFVPKLRRSTRKLWVIEQRPQQGDHDAGEANELIPQADVVGITGQAFANGTIDSLLNLCKPDAYVVVIGGTSPMSPLLFDYGVNVICGTKVIDADAVLKQVSQGAIFKQIGGIKLLTMME